MKKNARWFGFVFLVASFSFSGVTFGQWSAPDGWNCIHTYNPYLFLEHLSGGTTSSRLLFRSTGDNSGRIYQEDYTASDNTISSHFVISSTQNVYYADPIILRNSDASLGDKDIMRVYRDKVTIPGTAISGQTSTNVCIGTESPVNGYLLTVNGGAFLNGTVNTVDLNAANVFTWDLTVTSSHKLTIPNGNLCIGTTTPQSGYNLTVKGKIICGELKVESTTNWADYVFEEGYPLMPLNVLEQKVKTEKHLPGIPSASDVTKNGVNVSQMQSKLLEKVEELTLYVIQLKKENDQMKRENEQLKARVEVLEKK